MSNWDSKLLHYGQLFEERFMSLKVNISLEKSLDLGWSTLAECFLPEEAGIKKSMIEKYWPKKA
jgi:V/A-type H+-transporting ATPase subunit B